MVRKLARQLISYRRQSLWKLSNYFLDLSKAFDTLDQFKYTQKIDSVDTR